MFRSFLAVVFYFLMLACVRSTNAKAPVDPVLAANLQSKIESFVSTYDLPGISVTVMLPDNQIWNGSAGYSHIYTLEPMDTNKLFQMASVNKLFTSTMIFQLMEEGLLSLDDTVGKYLPPMTNVSAGITIRNLLTHKSGIADIATYPNIFYQWLNHPDSIWPHLLTIETFVQEPLFQQGASWSYSNTNYILLGMIIESITGHTFAQELHDRFCEPFGLNQIFFAPDDSIAGPETPGWTSFTTANVYDTDAALILNDCSASMFFTSGSIIAKPADVARFNRLLFTGKIISESSLAIMKTCTNVSFSDGCNGYGYGTMRYVFSGRTYFGHGGDVNGFTQLTIHDVADSVTLTMSVNRNYAPRGTMAPQLLTVIFESIISGINEAANHPVFSVYPYPATDQLNINMNISTPTPGIILMDALGRILPEPEMTIINGEMKLDVSMLKKGIYFVQVISEESSGVQRVVVH